MITEGCFDYQLYRDQCGHFDDGSVRRAIRNSGDNLEEQALTFAASSNLDVQTRLGLRMLRAAILQDSKEGPGQHTVFNRLLPIPDQGYKLCELVVDTSLPGSLKNLMKAASKVNYYQEVGDFIAGVCLLDWLAFKGVSWLKEEKA